MLAEGEKVQQEEEGGQPETGVWTPTGWWGEHRKEIGGDEVTGFAWYNTTQSILKKRNTFLNDKKKTTAW